MQLRLHDCVIDTDCRQVLRRGREVPLSPKAFQLLAMLAEARPRALSKDALHEALWPRTYVVDANLPNLVSEIRTALHDSAREPRFIRTVHGFGYAFCGDTGLDQETSGPATCYWLTCGDQQYRLHPGENIVGRALTADVRLDVAGVSRQHACIVVSGGQVFVEDAGSKNGTCVQGERITSRRALAPGDEVAFGSARVKLRAVDATEPTETV
jgi:DNA-binding winged helix-turn-helix (wHTH) protein